MKNLLRKSLAPVLLTAGIAGTAWRTAEGSRLEGPSEHTEVFYMSMNYYDESGDKHDDRIGDGSIALVVLGGLIKIVPKLRSQQNQEVTNA